MTKVNQNFALKLSRIEIAELKNGSFTPIQVLVAGNTSCESMQAHAETEGTSWKLFATGAHL